MTSNDWTKGWDWDTYRERVSEELVPMISDSLFTMSLVTEHAVDIKFAVELGISIMLDKPIIALVVPGVKVPDHLVRVADKIVEADLDDPQLAAAAIHQAIKELTEELGLKE